MAEKKEIAIDIQVNAESGVRSLSELKREFKETQKTLEGLSIDSEEYIQTLKRLGNTKDEIQDLNTTIRAFSPEGKVQAFGTAISGLASGLQAASGAAALLGIEGESLQKTLVKVMAASALADGIRGVVGLKDAFSDLRKVLSLTAIGQKLVTAAQWLWNAAMAANPIGLLIAGIVALVAAFKIFINVSEDSAKKQERLNKLEQEYAERLKQTGDAIRQRLNISINASDRELELMKAKGASEDALFAKEKKNMQKRLWALNYLEGYKSKLNDAELAEKADLLNKLAILDANYERKKIEESIKKEKENQDKLDAATKKREAHRLEIQKNIDAGTLQAIEESAQAAADAAEKSRKDEKDKLAASIKESQEEEKTDFEKNKEEELQKEINHLAAINELKKTAAIESKNLLMATSAVSDLLFTHQLNQAKGNAAKENEIRKKQFKVNKSVGIALATIDGIQAVQKALLISPLFAITTGIIAAANVAKIAATKFQGSDGGGGGDTGSLGIAGGGVTIPAPRTGSTLLNADGTIKLEDKAAAPVVKAIVTETDITKTQKKILAIEDKAKL